MRLIDADKLVNMLYDNEYTILCPLDEVSGVIDNCPTVANVAPVVHGRWIEKADHATCSACLSDCWSSSALGYDYCPECGAKMDGGSDHE